MSGNESRSADEALNAAVVRISGEKGTVAGAGFLVTPDRVLTCAHVVSDALDRKRNLEVAVGTTVLVDLPLADGLGRQHFTAEVEWWIPEAPEHCGDVAVLRLLDAIPGTCPLPMADSDELSDRRVRVVGFPDGELGVIRHRGELSGKVEGDWIQLSRADTRTVHITRGFSGSPVWDEQRGAAVGIVVAAEGKRDDTQQAFAISVEAVLRTLPDLARALTPDPFRGLDTFQENHNDIFFGRGDDIERVVTALKGDHPAVVVCGPSGCGKSSLVLAGVVPEIRREHQEQGEKFDAVVVNAGAEGSILANLASDLYKAARSGRFGDPRAASVDQVERWLANRGLVDTLNRLRGSTGGKYIVVLDQAEALLDRTEADIEEAAGLLVPRRRPGAGTRLLVTLRSDFMDAALKHPWLGPLLTDGRMLPLTPMSRDQLREVITKPLEKAPAVTYDPGLAQRILDDACRAPENLPLLGFVLKKLWDEQFAGRLRATTYEAMHGVQGALEEHCNKAWKQCVGENDRAAASRLLRGLVRVLPGSKTPLRRRLTREEAGGAGWELAKSFSARRLLVLSGTKGESETAELAHETLINIWPALREQVQEDAKFLAGRAELDHDLDRWAKEGRSPALLPGAIQLASFQGWLKDRENELTEEEQAFLAQTRRRRRARRAQVRAGWVAVALVLTLIAGLVTFLVQESNVSAQREAEGGSRALAVQSDELTDSKPGQAALSALAAYEMAPTQEARSALMRRYEELKDAAWVLSGAEGSIQAAAMSTDGGVTLATTETGRATLFVRMAKGRVRQEQLRLAANVLSPVVSRDGRRIAYLRERDGVVVWHDVTPSGKRLVGPAHPLRGGEISRFTLGAQGGDSKIMDFSPDARRLVGVSSEGAGAPTQHPVRLWDLETGELRMLPKQVSGLEEVWFGPDENSLVARRILDRTEQLESSAVTVDIGTGKLRELAEGTSWSGAGVSGDGSVVIVCREEPGSGKKEARYEAIRVADGRVLGSYGRGADSGCVDIAVDKTGEHFAVKATPDEWDLVGTRRGGTPQRFFSPDLDYSAVTAGLPLLGTPREPVLVTRDENAVTGWALAKFVGGTAYSPPKLLGDGNRMVVRAGEDGDTLRVMETEGDERTLAEVSIDAETPPDAKQELQVNSAETLVADVSDRNRITVRALPSLRQVAEFTAAQPPVGKDGKPELLRFLFLGDDQLMTVSGTRVEHWDAHESRRVSQPIDLRDLRLTTKDQPTYFVGRYPEAGYVGITVAGEPDVHAINLRTGKENKGLRVRLGDDLNVAVFLDDPRYAAVMTTGSMVELWSVRPGQSAKRVVGPLGPLNANRWMAGVPGGSGFFLANYSSVRFLKADDPGYRETYEFAEDQGFLAATKDGKALLRSPVSGGRLGLVRLDPTLWKRHLCEVLGRDFTHDERTGLPDSLPAEICAA
ncbi:serine protease [Streptomyces sp. rh207]|uniref:serine protease n=1 Tax=Streptomyces sp. rh207 TaxID=2034269 RepID=UPI00211D2B91|nr:serine protease [Streptomyces sp. rh207]